MGTNFGSYRVTDTFTGKLFLETFKTATAAHQFAAKLNLDPNRDRDAKVWAWHGPTQEFVEVSP